MDFRYAREDFQHRLTANLAFGGSRISLGHHSGSVDLVPCAEAGYKLSLGWKYTYCAMPCGELAEVIFCNVENVFYVDLFNKWSELEQEIQTVTVGTKRHLCLRSEKTMYFVDFSDAPLIFLRRDDGDKVTVSAVFDHPDLHNQMIYRERSWQIRTSFVRNPGESKSYNVYIYSMTDMDGILPVFERFPDGRHAALCITDHADYDQMNRLKAIYQGASDANRLRSKHGLLGLGIRTTKSVFYRSHHGYHGIGFHSYAEYEHFLCELYDAGHEIVPHGTSTLPATTEEVSKDLKAFAHFDPQTYIDHLFSRGILCPQSLAADGGNRGSEYFIGELLGDFGFKFIWSFGDVLDNPTCNISLLAARKHKPILRLKEIWRQLLRGKPRISAYQFVELLGEILSRNSRRSLRDIYDDIYGLWSGKTDNIFNILRHAKGLARDLINPLAIGARLFRYSHPLQWQPFLRVNNDLTGHPTCFFNTIRVNELSKLLSRGTFDALVEQNGMCVMHTYLSCNHFTRDNAWCDKGLWMEISDKIYPGLEDLSHRIRIGEIWNPVLREFLNWFIGWEQLRVRPKKKKWIIENKCSLKISELEVRWQAIGLPGHTTNVGQHSHFNLTPLSRKAISYID